MVVRRLGHAVVVDEDGRRADVRVLADRRVARRTTGAGPSSRCRSARSSSPRRCRSCRARRAGCRGAGRRTGRRSRRRRSPTRCRACGSRSRPRRPRRRSAWCPGRPPRRSPTVVAPCSWVPGSSRTSAASSTWTSTQVVAGSTTVTPARIQPSSTRRFSSAPTSASCTRSLTPSVCQTSSRPCALTRCPAARAMATTSVRYFSPCALSVVSSASAARSTRRVERVDAGVDLADRGLLGGGVLQLDHAGHRAVRLAQHPPVRLGVVQHRGQDGHRAARLARARRPGRRACRPRAAGRRRR